MLKITEGRVHYGACNLSDSRESSRSCSSAHRLSAHNGLEHDAAARKLQLDELRAHVNAKIVQVSCAAVFASLCSAKGGWIASYMAVSAVFA